MLIWGGMGREGGGGAGEAASLWGLFTRFICKICLYGFLLRFSCAIFIARVCLRNGYVVLSFFSRTNPRLPWSLG